MRTSPFMVFMAFAMTVVVVNDLYGQQTSSRRRSVRQDERVARANWQPTRDHIRSRSVDEPSSQSDEAEHLRESRVRTVNHQTPAKIEGLPTPPAEESVIQRMPSGETIEAVPLDGQIVLEPVPGSIVEGQIVEGVPVMGMPLACDALPASCGCDDLLCAGDCGTYNSCSTGRCGQGDCTTCGELCSDVAWRPCITLCLPQDGWVSFEYLSWWQDGMELPPLVTGSSNAGVARAQAGVLGAASTTTLFGGGDVLDDQFDGGRLRFGVWLDRSHTWGIGAEYFEIGREREGFRGTSSGNPILARPFFNTETGLEDSELVAFPNVIEGSIAVDVDSELAAGGFHVRYLTCCSEGRNRWLFSGQPEQYCSRTEARLGYRYVELEEGVLITEDLTSTDANSPGSFDIIDQFRTRNQFNGFDMGWMYRQTRGFWTFDSTIRLAVGNTRQTVAVAGQTTVNDPGNAPQVQTLPGGLLTQTSNLGIYRRNEFSVIPEFEANIGYQLTDHFKVTFGYTGIYWSNVVRPGEHISRDLNPNFLPPPANPLTGASRPAFAFDHTDYWVQGINFGGEYRW